MGTPALDTAYSDKCSVGSEGRAYMRSNSCTSASWPAVKIVPSADRSLASQLARNKSSASKSGFICSTTSSCIWLGVAEILQTGSGRAVGGKYLTRISHPELVFLFHCPNLKHAGVPNGATRALGDSLEAEASLWPKRMKGFSIA